MSTETPAVAATTEPVVAAEPAAAAAAPAEAAPVAAAADSSSSSSAAAPAAAKPEEEEAVEAADSTAEYQPLVSLKTIEVLTGEEDDEELYKQRTACYRFDKDSTSWKERGRGDVKLLQNKSTKAVRILLRQEKTLKLCMNHKVHPDIELVANAGSDRSWTWRTVDFSTEEPEKQTFALRFKDAETAQEFKNKYDESRKLNAQAAADKPAA